MGESANPDILRVAEAVGVQHHFLRKAAQSKPIARTADEADRILVHKVRVLAL
jgi:hypothetical protein